MTGKRGRTAAPDLPAVRGDVRPHAAERAGGRYRSSRHRALDLVAPLTDRACTRMVTRHRCSASLAAAGRVLQGWLAAEDGAGAEQLWLTADGDLQRFAVLYQVALLFVSELDPDLAVTKP